MHDESETKNNFFIQDCNKHDESGNSKHINDSKSVNEAKQIYDKDYKDDNVDKDDKDNLKVKLNKIIGNKTITSKKLNHESFLDNIQCY